MGGLSTDTLRGVQFIAAPTYTFDYSAQPCAAEDANGELQGDPFVGCLGGGVSACAGGYGGLKGGEQLDAAP